ncbi:MAG: thioredoxin family protein [Verrucomicrobiota bacterium]|jgi:hypothetical protein
MKNKFLVVLTAVALLVPSYRGLAAGTNAAAASDLQDLITRVKTSLQAGKQTEAEQAENLKQFDTLLAKYKGFEIIGISLDRAADKETLVNFTKTNNMPWRQYFDGGFWTNKLAVKYGIQSIPAAFLLDREGKIIAKGEDVRGPALEPAVAKALGAN